MPTDWLQELSDLRKGGGKIAPPPVSNSDVPDYLGELSSQARASKPDIAPAVPVGLHPAYLRNPRNPSEGVLSEEEYQASLTRGRESGRPTGFIEQVPRIASAVGEETTDVSRSGMDMFRGGLSDLGKANYFPTTPSSDPRTWTAGGLAKTAVGAGTMGLAPVLGATNAFGKFVGRVIGNEDFGNKVSMLAPLPIPMKGAGAVNAVRPSVSALHDIVKDIGPDLPQVINRLETNPRLTVMDVAPVVQSNVAGLASNPQSPGSLSHLKAAYDHRINTAKGSEIAAAEEALGPRPNVKETIDALEQAAKETGKKLIEPAVAAAKPVDVTALVRSIDKQFDPAVLASLKEGKTPAAPMSEPTKRLWDLRERLRGGLPDSDAMMLNPTDAHELQKELRRKWAGDPQLGYEARKVRRELVDAIDTSAGGKYKPALKQYADDKQVREAFDKGLSIFNESTSPKAVLENHPDMWKAWTEDASANEMEALRKGAAVAYDAKIRKMRRGLDIPEDSFGHEKLAAVVGDEKAAEMVRQLNDARDIAKTNSILFQGSETARRTLGAKNREVREVKPFNATNLLAPALGEFAGQWAGVPYLGGAALAAGGFAKQGLQKLGQKADVASNTAYARYASAIGEDREALLAALRKELMFRDAVGSRNKLGNLAPNPFLSALPQ